MLKRVQATRTGGGGRAPPTNDGTIRNRFFVDICSLDEWISMVVIIVGLLVIFIQLFLVVVVSNHNISDRISVSIPLVLCVQHYKFVCLVCSYSWL